MSLQSPHALLNEMTIKWLSVLKTFRVLKVFVLSREKAQCITFPVVADQTLSVLSSDPETMRFPQNCKQVMT
jgi:hypothetical protein